jgi:hypothetical protein
VSQSDPILETVGFELKSERGVRSDVCVYGELSLLSGFGATLMELEREKMASSADCPEDRMGERSGACT